MPSKYTYSCREQLHPNLMLIFAHIKQREKHSYLNAISYYAAHGADAKNFLPHTRNRKKKVFPLMHVKMKDFDERVKENFLFFACEMKIFHEHSGAVMFMIFYGYQNIYFLCLIFLSFPSKMRDTFSPSSLQV